MFKLAVNSCPVNPITIGGGVITPTAELNVCEDNPTVIWSTGAIKVPKVEPKETPVIGTNSIVPVINEPTLDPPEPQLLNLQKQVLQNLLILVNDRHHYLNLKFLNLLQLLHQ